jgi:biotin carboxylase
VQRKLLVLGAGPAQLGLLSAARRLGLAVIAADRDPSAPGFRYAERRAIVSVEDEQALERLARAEEVGGVAAAGSDRPVGIAARIADRFGLPHPVSPEIAARAVSPLRRRETLAAAGLPQTAGSVVHTVDEAREATGQLGLPCVVRAADRPGAGRVARSAAELEVGVAAVLEESRSDLCLVEALPPGPRLAVSGFVAEGALRVVTVTRRSPDLGVALSYSWPAGVEPAAIAGAVESARAAAAALEVTGGAFHVELVAADEGPVVAEATPRLGGGHDAELARLAAGVDLNELVARAAVGEPVTAQALVPSARVGGACVRFLVAPRGELREVQGLEEAFALDGIRGIRVYRRPGHVFGELTRAGDRAGAVLAVGDDRDEALARAGRAARLIRFETAAAERAAG